LWHGPVLFADDRLLARWIARGISIPTGLNLAASFLATLVIAFTTTWLAEQPFLRLRDRWFPSRAGSPLVTQPLAEPREAA
jgi:peptidoglycan/LPS O-acetylase OafA/YrhL